MTVEIRSIKILFVVQKNWQILESILSGQEYLVVEKVRLKVHLLPGGQKAYGSVADVLERNFSKRQRMGAPCVTISGQMVQVIM